MKESLFVRFFAAVLRVFFPQIAVKYFIKKGSRNATLYLPSVEKQLQLIEKLNFRDRELREREWSLETKLELLRKMNFALLSDVQTKEEFDIVSDRGSAKEIVAAMRHYTPEKKKLLELIRKNDKVVEGLVAVKPSVLDGFEVWELFSISKGSAVPTNDSRWIWAMNLSRRSSSWAPKFIDVLSRINSGNLVETGRKLFEFFFNLAYERGENVSELMPYMKKHFPSLYAKVRDNYRRYYDFSPYFCKMFPDTLCLKKHDIRDLRIKPAGAKPNGWADAYAWLAIGFELLNKSKVYQCVREALPELKSCLTAEAYNQLFEKMIDAAKSADDVKFLMEIGEDKFLHDLQKKLVGCSDALEFLQGQFPFKSWSEETAEAALVSLADKCMIPVDRIDELTPALKQIALDAMEASAEIAAIDYDVLRAVSVLSPFVPKAQKHLFMSNCCYSRDMRDAQNQYAENYRIDYEAFLYILNHHEDTERILELVMKQAQKLLLTPEQYLAVMQSRIRHKAPELKMRVLKSCK